MSRIVQFVLLLLTVFSISNCHPEELDPNVFVNVEDDFYIDMFEDISNGEDKFYITIKSIQTQDCKNSVINYLLEIDDEIDRIFISINDISEAETCEPGSAPALASVLIDGIEEQNYNMQINLKDAVFNAGIFSVDDKAYTLEMYTENGFEIIHDKLYKIPAKTIWGYVGFEEEGQKDIAEIFIRDLELISTDVGAAGGYGIGYYGYFTMYEDQSILMTEEANERFSNTFIFQFDGNTQELQSIINEYCTANPDVNFYIFDDGGSVLNCQ